MKFMAMRFISMTSKTTPSVVSLLSIAAGLVLCAASVTAQTSSFVLFDAPGAGTSTYQGTTPFAISSTELIAGNYTDSSSHSHGFIRGVNGKITDFDVPQINEPVVTGLNALGQIIGYGTGPDALAHSFLRNANGSFLRVDPPGATISVPKGISDNGQLVGFYEDKALVAHGFLRDTSGAFTLIDDPEAYQGPQVGTVCIAINASGVITGNYVDKNTGTVRAFVRDAAGDFTNFDPVVGSAAAYPVNINASGQVAGYYSTSGSRASHSFVRDASGNVTAFDMPGATDTYAASMNDSGVIVGVWDNNTSVQGFQRDAAGKLTSISIGGSRNRGTRVLGINNTGSITGFYADENQADHGFVSKNGLTK